MNTQEQIAFQNGFVVGTSIKQLLPMGTAYNPDVWNDEGIYSYFYIDFKQPVERFSLGMATESINVLASFLRTITAIERINSTTYKVVCDIDNANRGIIVTGKVNSEIRYASGKSIPEFVSFFFVSGVAYSQNLPYQYEIVTIVDNNNMSVTSVDEILLYSPIIVNGIESSVAPYPSTLPTISENRVIIER